MCFTVYIFIESLELFGDILQIDYQSQLSISSKHLSAALITKYVLFLLTECRRSTVNKNCNIELEFYDLPDGLKMAVAAAVAACLIK